ncbi:mechanosensitive ion channel protein MscS [Aquisalinus flavus]|uniref:Small-conductance mechanosensitive channel n=1 Tax=Aquisalinus flavus TaxID=1526572 RepID=A0A8J2V6W3_9PROT|nr:mechanosensitive ion channel family protein [Aquisalinus flavus]MBD0428037.1 mechanosensitive ion channel [Aquisalinus flavus]GGD19178.1 mechanosensitive ion channel protein MscS [Aquisalinus flavus]
MRLKFLLFLCLVPIAFGAVHAQDEAAETAPVIETQEENAGPDEDIETRIEGIFSQIPSLSTVDVTVQDGVVTLSGMVPDSEALAQAQSIAARVSGVVTVSNDLERDITVGGRLNPATAKLRGALLEAYALLPLIGVALVVFLLFLLAGLFIARQEGLWRRVAPNAFVAGMISAIIRIVFALVGIILALTILDAVALLGAFLGAAGVIGLAIGFAVRDTIENFIASIMLSLRQPFRPNDLVQIGDRLGNVVRLTSRATILMTPDGNHLRIPNSVVFKAIIENFSRNPERRFEFQLGIDAEDDPQAALDTVMPSLRTLPFVLADPPPAAWIDAVGDSNIVLTLTGWLDQRETDFMKGRSQAIRIAKAVLETNGFTLPEPIYRLRIEGLKDGIALPAGTGGTVSETTPDTPAPQTPVKRTPLKSVPEMPDAEDTAVDRSLEEKVAEDRAGAGDDLLSDNAPTEFGDEGKKKA